MSPNRALPSVDLIYRVAFPGAATTPRARVRRTRLAPVARNIAGLAMRVDERQEVIDPSGL